MTTLHNEALEAPSAEIPGAEVPGAEVPAELVARAAELLSMGEGLTSFLVSRSGADEERPARGRGPRLVVAREAGGRHGRAVVELPAGTPTGEQPADVAEPVVSHGGHRVYRDDQRPTRPDRRAFFGAAAGAMAVGIFFAGGAILGGGHEASPPGAARLARAAAQAWLSGTRFSGPARGDVGALLDRGGPALAGQLEPAGSRSASGLFSEQFVVGGPAGAYGLSVVVYRGYVVYPPTPSPLPFVEPTGASVPETGTWVTTNVAHSVANWATTTFAPTGALRSAGLALAGKALVLDEWRPGSGANLVARVQVPLASADGFAAYEARHVLAAAQQAALAGRRALAGSAAGLRLAEEQAGADDTAAQQDVQAASAGAPLSKGAVAAQSQAGGAQVAVAKAEDAFRAAEGNLGAAERQEASAKAGLAKTQAQPASASGVYDVVFDRQGNIVAWAPAEYGA